MSRLEELMAEMDKRGELTPKLKSGVEELIKRGEQKKEEEFGVLDYLMGVLEPAGMMATGMTAEPISGLAGIVAAILPGEEGKAAEVVKKVQEYFTYQPRTRGGKAGLEKMGEFIGPTAELVGKVPEAVGEVGYKLGGPVGGATYVTLLAAIPEILGLKGTRAAKKIAMNRALKGQDISGLYDELGQLLPEIRKGLDKAGIDISEIKDVLPSSIPEEQIKEAAGRIGEAAKAKLRPESKALKIAEEAKPSAEVLAAIDEIGLSGQSLASHTSQNPTFIAVEQGLKSIPGSQMAAKEKAFISSLSKKADELIVEYGGAIDKSLLSDEFRSSSLGIIHDLEKAADEAYDRLRDAIPQRLQVSANNTRRAIVEQADELGGIKYLDKNEKLLFSVLDPDSNPTYARLDKYRKQIGQALRKNTGPFKDADEGALKKLYSSLSEDQNLIAESQNVGELYKTATELVVSRKAIEKQLVNVLGKDLAGAVTAKGRSSILGLQTGNTKQFDILLENIPEGLGREIRQSVIVTSLNDAFTQGSRMEKSLSIPAFDDFMTGLKRHKGSYNRLKKEIGNDAMGRLETLHTVINGVRNAQKSAITTGRIVAVPKMFDEVDNLASRLYGGVKNIIKAEGVTSTMGLPGLGTAGVIGSALGAKRTARSIAADQLLASPKFQDLLRKKAVGKMNTEKKLRAAEKTLNKIKEYQRWKSSLDEKSIADLLVVGGIGYLTAETIDTGEE